MIEISTKIHDRYSTEFKLGYVTDKELRQEDFLLGMWIFLPGGLDITPSTFTKVTFYKNFKSNVRLITPRVSLYDIVSGDAVPFNSLLNPGDDFDYRLKIFVSIVKSSLRDEGDRIMSLGEGSKALCDRYAEEAMTILDRYQSLEVPHRWAQDYGLCEEYLCNVMAGTMFKMMGRGFGTRSFPEVIYRIDGIREKRGYVRVNPDRPEDNREFISRQAGIKKYAEGQLYLRVPKTRDGFLAEQAYYSVAAGLAMLFATIVAWAFQRQFGNLTWPLFIALIISYMLKDRIKELTRYYFSHRVGSKYFDNKADIRYKDTKLGVLKEGMDFVKRDKIPQDVLELRSRDNDSPLLQAEESTILYRKKVHIDRDALDRISIYEHEGINDIIRLHFEGFLRKADNPVSYVGYLNDGGELIKVPCERDYCIHIIFQYEHDGGTDLKLFRVSLNRDGIKEINEI